MDGKYPSPGAWDGILCRPIASVKMPCRRLWTHHAAPGCTGLVWLLYEVSHPGIGLDRSHTPCCRYSVWTSCIRPCWQTGHWAPGSPDGTAGASRSTVASWAKGRLTCPSSVRHCANFSWRTRFAKKPKCRILWKPCGGTWSISRRRNSTASSVMVRRRWPRV